MLEEVDRLTYLVENSLLLTRADARHIPMTRTAVDLGELVKGVAENFRVLAEERHQTFSVDVAGPITTECDGAILRSGSRSSAASFRTLRDWFPNREHTQPFEGNGSGCLHERPPEIDAPSSDGIRASRAFVRLPEQCGTPCFRQRFRVPLPHHLLGEITVIHGFTPCGARR